MKNKTQKKPRDSRQDVYRNPLRRKMFTLEVPAEMWTLAFGRLSFADRLRVRATCKYFRDLVDNTRWGDWIVDLRKSGEEYEDDFWRMLRRWRVTSVRLFSDHGCETLADELPNLTHLIINIRYYTMPDFRIFNNLDRLHVIHHTAVDLDLLFRTLPRRLTHLRVCQCFNISAPILPFGIHPNSQLKKLKSFAFHCVSDIHPVEMLHFFLYGLPQLQHFSMDMYTDDPYYGIVSDLRPLHNRSLSSLELTGCQTQCLPVDFADMLRTLPSLRSLAMFCSKYKCHDASLKLSAWLRDLPALTSLVVESNDVRGIVGSIPSSVTRLSLLPLYIAPQIMTALSARVPNIQHLHVEPHEDPLGSDAALIPQLFPRLNTLRLCHSQVPEDAFLSLASLKELEILEMQDDEPPPAGLVSKLRALTNNRVTINKKPDTNKLWMKYCSCMPHIPTHYWA